MYVSKRQKFVDRTVESSVGERPRIDQVKNDARIDGMLGFVPGGPVGWHVSRSSETWYRKRGRIS